MSKDRNINLGEKALEALEKSTKLLKIANRLERQGNVTESLRLRDEARSQRNISVWLMARANDSTIDEKGRPHDH